MALIQDGVYDLSSDFPTVSDLLEHPAPGKAVQKCKVNFIGTVEEILANTGPHCDRSKPYFLSPVDLQVIKAAGVTFASSLIERVIEEKARGDAAKADNLRAMVRETIGSSLCDIKPGSEQAAHLKEILLGQDLWSQYLEVGIGPDAEIFTKAPVLSTVGSGEHIGVHPSSLWNNPEPEVVVIVNSRAEIVGATLGNDVNLRDVEGRSALLLGKAKDNNASCSIGPFIRLFDEHFTLDTVRSCTVELEVRGTDGFVLEGKSFMNEISRAPEDLVSQAINPHHQYPDGLALFLGTLFAPTKDRDFKGAGFTHRLGDQVVISSPQLGALRNTVTHTHLAKPWNFGITALLRNLSNRGIIK